MLDILFSKITQSDFQGVRLGFHMLLIQAFTESQNDSMIGVGRHL